MRLLLIPALVLGLSGCEFFRSLNTEENRQLGVEAAISAIETLNADGFDPVQLTDGQVALITMACNVLAAYLPTLEEDLDKRAELVALGQDVCEVFGVALGAGPVEAPAPVVQP